MEANLPVRFPVYFAYNRSFWTERNSQNVAIVTEDYDAQNAGELSIRKGDRIIVLERRRNYNKSAYAPLWEGLYHGHIGLFPYRCIGEEDQKFEVTGAKDYSMYMSMWSKAQQYKQKEVYVEPPFTVKEEYVYTPYTGNNRVVTALYRYIASRDDELTFNEGDKIEILQEYEDWPFVRISK